MAKHWRVQFIGGPLDGEWHESLAAMVPAEIEEHGHGVVHRYRVDVANQRAEFIKTTATSHEGKRP